MTPRRVFLADGYQLSAVSEEGKRKQFNQSLPHVALTDAGQEVFGDCAYRSVKSMDKFVLGRAPKRRHYERKENR